MIEKNEYYTENRIPKRKDKKYKSIENYKPYELTHCIVFEMAGRNKEVRSLIKVVGELREILKIKYKVKRNKNDKALIDLDKELGITKRIEVSKEEYNALEKKRLKFQFDYEKGIRTLKHKYYIHFDQTNINIPEIENPFKEKDFSGMALEDIEEDFLDALRSPMMNHISGTVGKFLHGEDYPDYKSDHNIYEGFTTARGINTRCKTFNISNINTHFQRKIYDTNEVNVALNMTLPENELVEYIRHIKKTLSNENSEELKTPNTLLGKNVQKVEKVQNYPKKQTAEKLADMFFTYDYVSTRLKNHESSEKLTEREYEEEKDSIKKNPSYTSDEKKCQLQNLSKEYEKNRISLKIEDIFKDFDDSIEKISFKSSTASNYYYALKPYIEECRYIEFLTGESIIDTQEGKEEVSG